MDHSETILSLIIRQTTLLWLPETTESIAPFLFISCSCTVLHPLRSWHMNSYPYGPMTNAYVPRCYWPASIFSKVRQFLSDAQTEGNMLWRNCHRSTMDPRWLETKNINQGRLQSSGPFKITTSSRRISTNYVTGIPDPGRRETEYCNLPLIPPQVAAKAKLSKVAPFNFELDAYETYVVPTLLYK